MQKPMGYKLKSQRMLPLPSIVKRVSMLWDRKKNKCATVEKKWQLTYLDDIFWPCIKNRRNMSSVMDTNKETSDRKEKKSNFNLLQTCQTIRNIFFLIFKSIYYISKLVLYLQAGFRKGRGTRDQIANIHWIIKKAREF